MRELALRQALGPDHDIAFPLYASIMKFGASSMQKT